MTYIRPAYRKTERKTIAGKVIGMSQKPSYAPGNPPVWMMRVERANGMVYQGTVPAGKNVKVGDFVRFTCKATYNRREAMGRFYNPRSFEVLPYSGTSSSDELTAL